MSNRLKQIGKNIADISRGAYHGSVVTAENSVTWAYEEIRDVVDLAFLGKVTEPRSEPSNNHLSQIPRNAYGICSAVSAGLATFSLEALLIYQGVSKFVEGFSRL